MRLFLSRVRRGALLWACALGACAASALGAEINGVSYTSLPAVAKKFGLKAEWAVKGKTMRLRGAALSLTANIHERSVKLNETPLALGSPIASLGGMFYMSERDVSKTLQPLLQPHVFAPRPPLGYIVIDAGHGGKDPGAQNRAYSLVEKTLALDVAKRLQRILQERGYRVSLTRTDDRFIALPARTEIANRRGADLFVSIHFNSAKDTSATGIETWAMTPAWQMSTGRNTAHASDRITQENNRYDPWNVLAAYYVNDSLRAQTGAASRGVKRARWDVIKGSRCPALLVECGFLTNAREARLIATPAYREKLALGIADGIRRYQRTLNRIGAPAQKK